MLDKPHRSGGVRRLHHLTVSFALEEDPTLVDGLRCLPQVCRAPFRNRIRSLTVVDGVDTDELQLLVDLLEDSFTPSRRHLPDDLVYGLAVTLQVRILLIVEVVACVGRQQVVLSVLEDLGSDFGISLFESERSTWTILIAQILHHPDDALVSPLRRVTENPLETGTLDWIVEIERLVSCTATEDFPFLRTLHRELALPHSVGFFV